MKFYRVGVARRESKRPQSVAAMPDVVAKGLCIIRNKSGLEITRARPLFGDMKSAVFGVT